jgi:hypothetical protein
VRTKLLLAAVCILVLPMWFSQSPGDKLINSTPFATVALAGHTLLGNWCDCGTPGCICDPGEQQGGQSAHPVADKSRTSKGRAPVGADPRGEFAFGSGALLLVFALFVWSRLA